MPGLRGGGGRERVASRSSSPRPTPDAGAAPRRGTDLAAVPAGEEHGASPDAAPEAAADGTAGTADAHADVVAPEPTAESPAPEQDAVDDVRDLLADSALETGPVEREGVGTADDDRPEPQDASSAASEQGDDEIVEATGVDAEADVEAAAEPETESESEPETETESDAQTEPETEVEPEPARAVTVRTDSLTSPRSTRPGLAGVGETALTPSVRGSARPPPTSGTTSS
ncbi:hypothetical protein [Clavibacter capsici]|uniref:hypothetical protein n=1 Tax=Clavibacter capsici TaxID=1874630 RepID=UPI0014280168|nr:hypothetical protein [Clavibacter capsici]QIS38939.1 hypothetical protein GW572_06480 [Clavibacter capsici]